MSDDIVKTLLESLTPEQKDRLVQGLLNSNVKGGETKGDSKSQEVDTNKITKQPERKNTSDFTVNNNNLKQRSQVVRAKKNSWVDNGEFRDEEVDYIKFEKMKTPRKRGKPKKKEVECHVCGKSFLVNESIVFGEYLRCNRCTGR